MPSPLLYVQTFLIAASASAVMVLALGGRWRTTGTEVANRMALVGIACGVTSGCFWLPLTIAWPPASALDRFFMLILPVTIGVEALATLAWMPRWLTASFRAGIAASIGRVVLHGSVYMSQWTALQCAAMLVASVLVIGVAWWALLRLGERGPGMPVPLTILLMLQSAGVVTMLAGYLRGGAAAMVMTAALLATTVAMKWSTPRVPHSAILGVSIVSLSSLLMVGVYFGRLPTTSALLLFGAPLLGWLTEARWLKERLTPRTNGIVRVMLVALIAAIVLFVAKRKFDREFRPLLQRHRVTTSQSLVATIGLPQRTSTRPS